MGHVMVFALTTALFAPAWAQNPAAVTHTQPGGSGAMQASGKTGSAAEQEIAALDEQGRKAALTNDASYLEKNLSTDYIGVGPDGMAANKEQAIAERRDGSLKFTAMDSHDTKITVYGSTALVTILATVAGNYKGHDIAGSYRVSEIWVNQHGTWQNVYEQVTRVQSGPTATASQ